MAVIFIYVFIVLIGDAAAILISAAVEKFSASGSLLVFFVLFSLVFWIGWILAVNITERLFKA